MRSTWFSWGALAAAAGLAMGCPAPDYDFPNDDDAGMTAPSGDSATPDPTTSATTMNSTTMSSAEGGPTTNMDGSSTGSVAEEDGPPPIKLDVGSLPDGGGSGCTAPPPVTCDNMDDDPWHAIGLNCPGGPQVNGSINLDAPEQIYVHTGNLGTFVPPPFPPREGNKFVILSSGVAQDLTVPALFASTDVGGFGGTPLPPPIQTNAVSPTQDCTENPALIGTGDCSNTIEDQWSQGSGSYDYGEMRIEVQVPAGAPGLSYDFAMFSTEYPGFYQTQYNDMYIAWLESEEWTGNISFDDMGNPISLNAGFLDYKDAPNPFDCPAPCEAPELQGTAMEGHAGTRWLTTTAGVTPGENIELIFGIFDLSDGVLDTVMIIDNFQWTCEGGGPVTIPG